MVLGCYVKEISPAICANLICVNQIGIQPEYHCVSECNTRFSIV